MNNIYDEWITKPDVCRCCLAASGISDLTKYSGATSEYTFLDTLQNCFHITLSMEEGCSHKICSACAENIENLKKFHDQVQYTENLYRKYWEEKKDSENTQLCPMKNDNIIKSEDCNSNIEDSDAPKYIFIKIEKDISYEYRNEEHSDSEDKQLCLLNNDNIKIEDGNSNSDSDTPIVSFINKEKDNLPGNEISGTFKVVQKTKQVSERKRIRITCEIVLTETTACPFRHYKSWFQCFFCYKDFMELNLLRDHTIKNHGNVKEELKKKKRYPGSLQIDISNLECRKCQMSLTDVESMRSHFECVHDKVIYIECIADYKVDSSPYSCHICGKEFHVFRSLSTHLNEHYANCICDECGKSFLNPTRLRIHKLTHENGAYPCKKCGKILRTQNSRSNHMKSAHSKRVITCNICEKTLKHYNERVKHMSEVHNITYNFKCPYCEQSFKIKNYLASHIRRAHGSKKCCEYSMSFITDNGLKKNNKTTGAKPSCKICCKTRNNSLGQNMREQKTDNK